MACAVVGDVRLPYICVCCAYYSLFSEVQYHPMIPFNIRMYVQYTLLSC